jgi:hypothetical protein
LASEPAAAAALAAAGGTTVAELAVLMMKLERNVFDLGLFPIAALLNHSCQPNCQGFASNVGAASGGVPGSGRGMGEVVGAARIFEVVAITDVSAGERLNISYLSTAMLCASF